MNKVLAILALISSSAFAGTAWKSVYTNLDNDCVTVSQSNQNAVIDFQELECKSFGGYRLGVEGGDLRYKPTLKYGPTTIQMDSVGAFSDTGSKNIEWVYLHETARDGAGKVQWKGLIYRLSIQDGQSGQSRTELFAVRLDGSKSCLVGSTTDNLKARQLVYNSRPGCK